ncbi:MAG: [protein-PII] uridylyltransferase [Rhodospirillaceae bacterium]|jgi:[protein-PII] uridylyltransferase|nr:[protein-PII] uridylyltransferase [Rhodospirillaceae bacterium]MBT6117365.1 [protein-PII] uridylyltransferase [Rhodospirillaceae bacterium]
MARVPRKRQIVDRHALHRAVDAIAAEHDRSDARRRALMALLSRTLEEGRAEIRARFDDGAGGAETAAAGSYLMDRIVRALFDYARKHAYPVANPTAGERLTLAAMGGYGRGELAPFSDLDLLFLIPYKLPPQTEQTVEFLLYALWDLGLKVGHAVRSTDDCVRLANKDLTIRTALLECRFVAGDAGLLTEMRQRYADEVMAGTALNFVTAKLDERDRRHRRVGDSRYVLEPNIKEGKGGLRDLHTLLWIARYVYRTRSIADLVKRGTLTPKEGQKFERAANFLWTLRCHLHYLAGRAEETLTFDVQPEIARRMGYDDDDANLGVERFMKRYFLVAKAVGDLTRIFCAAIEAEHRRRPADSGGAGEEREPIDGFHLEGGRLVPATDDAFDRDPCGLLRLFHSSLNRNLDIHPRALRLVTRKLDLVDEDLRHDPEANRLFMDILTSPKGPEVALRRLNEAGVLGRFIPDFGRVVAQMQYDMYHVYTVDEHTIQAIGILSKIERGLLREDHPVASDIVHNVLSRRVLYLALLLHDTAKGRGGDHQEKGARIAQRLAPRLGLDPGETDNAVWLVRHQETMSEFAFQRDLGDPKTIEDFAALVQSPERLRLLLVMTVCDIRAVGPNVWNGWKAQLLRELYRRAEELISGGLGSLPAVERVEAAQADLRAALDDWDDGAFAEHIARMPAAYWLATSLDGQIRHARLVRGQRDGATEPGIDVAIDRAASITDVTVCAPDRAGLFSTLAGAIAVGGADITAARIVTTADGLALDSFLVQEVPALAEAPRLALTDESGIARLRDAILGCLAGEIDIPSELARRRARPSRARLFDVPMRVLIDDRASATHTVIEVNGRDRPGLLHDLTKALTELRLQISTAKISTFGEQVVDVFYVRDAFGLNVTKPSRLEAIRARLLEALRDPDEAREAAE